MGPLEPTKVNAGSAASIEDYDDYWGDRAKGPGIDAPSAAGKRPTAPG
ncbi:hypothetical protein [Streptomyces sp. NPDC007205]